MLDMERRETLREDLVTLGMLQTAYKANMIPFDQVRWQTDLVEHGLGITRQVAPTPTPKRVASTPYDHRRPSHYQHMMVIDGEVKVKCACCPALIRVNGADKAPVKIGVYSKTVRLAGWVTVNGVPEWSDVEVPKVEPILKSLYCCQSCLDRHSGNTRTLPISLPPSPTRFFPRVEKIEFQGHPKRNGIIFEEDGSIREINPRVADPKEEDPAQVATWVRAARRQNAQKWNWD